MSTTNFTYELSATDGAARAGTFHTPHGPLHTPVFAPVGTRGTVKALTPAQLKQLGASLVLANTYHLELRPGSDVVQEMGGLHHFMQWDGPILTDSGGFQVWSLGGINQVDDDGVTFRSHIDGSLQRLTPERSIEIQQALGADIIMAFDELADPDNYEYMKRAMARTHRWAVRSREAWTNCDRQALFGIVQGGIFDDLRAESAQTLAALDLPGYAIGGLSVGESKPDMYHTLEVTTPLLPANKPRYLMGVGTIEDLVNGVARGVDIFDCVLPTRIARHGSALTYNGQFNMKNQRFERDPGPIEEGCACYACQNFSRAYVRHLVRSKEMLAGTLLSIHNVHTLVRLAQDMRQAIVAGTFDAFAADVLKHLAPNASPTTSNQA